MSSLRCCTFNCRGWNSGYVTLKYIIDSLDICFIQEHWLLKDKLSKVNDISPDFISETSVGHYPIARTRIRMGPRHEGG